MSALLELGGSVTHFLILSANCVAVINPCITAHIVERLSTKLLGAKDLPTGFMGMRPSSDFQGIPVLGPNMDAVARNAMAG